MQTWRVIYNTIDGDDSIWIDANDVDVDANNPNAVIADSIRIDFMMPVTSVRIVADLEGSSPAQAEAKYYKVKMLGITRIGLKAKVVVYLGLNVENGLFPLVNSQVFTSKGEVCGCSLPFPPEGYCGLCGQSRSGSDGD